MRQIIEGFEDTMVCPIELWDAEGEPTARDVLWIQQDDTDLLEIDKRQAKALIAALQDFCRR